MGRSATGESDRGNYLVLTLILCSLTLATPAVAASNSRARMSPPTAQATTQQPKSAEVGELRPGAPVERELTAGESHSYKIALSSGQYVHVTAEQLGVNVEVSLSDPAGRQLASLDWWWREGEESLWAVAESQGEYVLKVSAADEPTAEGKYRVALEKIDELDGAAAKERDMVAAHRAYAEGDRLLSQPTPESLRLATGKMQEALSLWRALGDTDAQAHALYELGDISFQAGNLKQAPEYLSQAIPLFQAAGNRYGEANALHSVGDAYSFSGETQKGLDNYNRALTLARAINNHVIESDVLSGLGLVFQNLGQTPKALETLEQALSVAHAAGYTGGEAAAHNNIGLVYVGLGRLRDAVGHYRQSLALQRAGENLLGQGILFNNIGNAYTRMGEFQKALEFLTQGLELRRRIGDKRGEASNLGSIGFLYIALGDYQRALQYYGEALTKSRAVDNHAVELAALLNLGTIYFRTGDLPKSLDYFNQALAFATLPGDLNAKAFVLTGLGSISARSGDTHKALDYFERALSIRIERGSQYGEAQVLSVIGATYLQMGESEKAFDYLTRALTLSRSINDRMGEASTLYQLARLDRDRGNIAEARSHAEAALALVESVRAKVTLSDSRATYFASQQDYYDLYIDLLMQSYKSERDEKYLSDALFANERRSARSLLDSLAEARADIHAGVSADLLERERNLSQDLNARADQQARLLGGKHTAEQAEAVAKDIEALTTEYDQVLARIRDASPRYAALTQPRPLSASGIQKTLDADTLLLEYSLGEERSYLWAVTPTSVTSFVLPKRSEIEATARRVYDLLVSKSDALYPEAMSALSRTLLGPVSGQLQRKRLLIVADGALQYVPFGALPEQPPATAKGGVATGGYRPLITEHEVVSLPSASVVALLRSEAGRRAATKTVAVFADPVFGKDDPRVKAKAGAPVAQKGTDGAGASPSDVERSANDLGITTFDRLPVSRREAQLIEAAAPKGQSLVAVDFAASRATAMSPELGGYQIVHFATHSLINDRHPELSGIVLSLVDERGQPQDGFLRLHDIYNMRLDADLVVLSACQTALGQEIRGEGLVGLTRGFMYAGAPRVIASMWNVGDEATAELMSRFYKNILRGGMRPAAALRAAQVSMWKERRWAAPYYWAGFVLQGEWR